MALNPVAYTEKVVGSFLRYQLTAYPFMDEGLRGQMRDLLSLDETRQSPLLKGPYVSLSRPFRQGAAVKDLVADGLLHPHLRERIPEAITHLYSHQEKAVRAVAEGRTTLVSTGTGSGKTECFLYPIVSKCLALRDEDAPPGVSAVIVYPMNALAEDQLLRLRDLLAGTGVSFGIYVGKTPEGESGVTGLRLPAGSSRADYRARLEQARKDGQGEAVYPAEEVCSREAMRTPGRQPRILLTNVKQLELLLTRRRDIELFAGARLDYLVFDEAHTFAGVMGAESACLLRRLRAFCDAGPERTTCIATSATIVDREDPEAARNFAARFFGVAPGDVATVGEDYEAEVWANRRFLPPTPQDDDAGILNECVRAVEDEDSAGGRVRAAYRSLSGRTLPGADDDGDGNGNSSGWREALHAALSHNEVVYALNEELVEPRALEALPAALEQRIGRPVSQAEILSWLTLGAAARLQGRPLLRPVVHAFVRGVGGAVASFPDGASGPRLWLAAEDEAASNGPDGARARFPVTTCTTCGQHYFVAFLKDFTFTGTKPGGGNASPSGPWWERLDQKAGGKRVLVTDRLIGADETDDDAPPHKRTASLAFCRRCGAAHASAQSSCSACGRPGPLLELRAVRQKQDNPGLLTSCLSCGSVGRRPSGGRYREPAREVRAVNVADVHVLSQDMVQHAERRRLLVFCDNRQDAAFQAGWMKDHARRFRLRALMSQALEADTTSVGDLTACLDDRLDEDEALSRALIPEVWQAAPSDGAGVRHRQERRKYLRIQVLREVALSPRQAYGLEPWGRMKVEYDGLSSTDPWIRRHAHQLGIPPDKMREGVASVLDYLRRKRALFDPVHEVFTKHWMDGDREVQQGYLPGFLKPNATKLRREPTEKPAQVTQWLSTGGGDTTMRQVARKWGVAGDAVEAFLEGLFEYVVEAGLLVRVVLKGSKKRPLPGVSGVFQVAADKLLLKPNRGVWRCRKCRRKATRDVPHGLCPAWRCDGPLEWIKEDPDDYNLRLLDGDYSMLRSEEHTAMVPPDERDRLENRFKGESDAVNCLVCTPTLELGIDIGRLDSVLMRNVPPLPANYWQRAGRAGRRHRMAVNVTYCRPVSHDRAYFADPPKLLGGKIDPPAFNLRNEVMVAKHVHAVAIGALYRYSQDPERPEAERNRIRNVLNSALPRRVAPYLFADGEVRDASFDFDPLRHLVEDLSDSLAHDPKRVFRQGWPEADAAVVADAALQGHVQRFADELEEVVARLRHRLKWAMRQIGRLNREQERKGSLEPPEEALRRRCDRLVKQLKGTSPRNWRHAEGHDDANTFGVLAAEGFLPGYGLETGAVTGWAEVPFWKAGPAEFRLPRPPATALREYVPGNLIYANGHRFAARRFHRDANERRTDMATYAVSRKRRAVAEVHGASGTDGDATLPTMAVCDVDLVHTSHISDEEDLRFQLGVAVAGVERDQHSGGDAYRWGAQSLLLRRGVRMRLVNVGPATSMDGGGALGYPVCSVCGHSVSPFASDRQREEFDKGHEERCNRKPGLVGFHADVIADALSLPACDGQTTAHSVLEALRFGAARVLDMHIDDLQVLVVGKMHEEAVDALLWDPMPGGSGLLERICDRFGEVVAAARRVVGECPALCESACTDCLQTFRNAYYHRFLDRGNAVKRFDKWGSSLAWEHKVPPRQPDATLPRNSAVPVNAAEAKLRRLLLRAGFGEGGRGEQIRLDRALGTTTPDVIYRGPGHDADEGVCIYLDGLSRHLHGNPETAERDAQIRSWLQNKGYDVVEVAVHDLDDADAMARHFRRLARCLGMGERAKKLGTDRSWFPAPESSDAGERPRLRLIRPDPAQRYVTCVPFMPLKAAAGAFGDPQTLAEDDDEREWLEVEAGRALRPGMFAAQVEGRSMEPRIPDGSYCLFRPDVAGTRQGRVLLVQLLDQVDPETGYRFTVKRYRSKKRQDEGGWRHVKVTLEPDNPDFAPIEIATDDEATVDVVAEFVAVLGAG